MIFDEAHNLKNLQSQKTLKGSAVVSKAKHIVFATATPMDTPPGSVYFMAQVTGIPVEKLGEMLGFRWTIVRDNNGQEKNQVALMKGKKWDDVL
ncbi:MAG: hypothetical protein NT134_01555, partial [Chloroflexi bacterium]|nr:hypothetical protein [Chloroflexota bacterium]